MRRVLFRLWLAGTVLWGAFVFWAQSHDARPAGTLIAIAAEAVLVPSGIIFVIGTMLVWAFGGFSRHN